MPLKSLLFKTAVFAKELVFLLKRPKVKQKCIMKVPYYSQWESPKLVENIINGKFNAIDDPAWKNSGAENKNDYLNWSWNGCGMACLKMVLSAISREEFQLVELGRECAKYGGYKIDQTAYARADYKRSIDGLYYDPLVRFVKDKFGIKALVVAPLVLKEIIENVSAGNYVIASVSAAIRHPKSDPLHPGGHLVLITGYDLKDQSLLIHNPSGFWQESQEYAKIGFNDFKKFFSNRGVIIFS